jgi:2-keto-3-deoxy-L-rhamnonate aldolase RhmA
VNPAAFRTRLGEPLIGTFLKSASHQAAELLGLAGLDCIVVDAEHAPFGPGDLDRIALAARGTGCPTLVRVPTIDPGLINTCLDLGMAGIVVPHVRSVEDARDAVAAATYAGRRGFSPSTRAAAYGLRGAAAHRVASDRTVTVWAQIEDREALDHLDAIAAVDGIDCLFVGRADLALSLGVEDTTHPSVAAALAAVAAAAEGAGKAAGLFVPGIEELPARLREGFTCFVCGSDQSFLLQGARRLKTALDTASPTPKAPD